MKRIETIHQKLKQLIAKDVNFKTFGSKEPWNGHEYNLHPCIRLNKLADIERSAKIKLPEEYKEYITLIADGGAGPYYGLYCLNEGIDKQASYFDENEQNLETFFQSFPYNNEDVISKIDSNTTILDDGEALFRREHPTPGIIFLAEYGCGGYYVLVINGEQYGKVWFFHSDGFLNPCCIEGKQLNFFDWYENWLDTSLNDLNKSIPHISKDI
jgi:hypothetical protein